MRLKYLESWSVEICAGITFQRGIKGNRYVFILAGALATCAASYLRRGGIMSVWVHVFGRL